MPALHPAAAAQGPIRILAFGDSLMAGYGVRKGEGFVPQLEALLRAEGLDAEVVNGGVSGNTTGHARSRVRWTLDALRPPPDLALVSFGGNDILRAVPPEETRADLRAVLDEFARRRIPVVLAGMLAPPFLGARYTRAFNAIFPELAAEYGLPFYPFLLAGVAGNARLNLPDRVHPNAAGIARMVKGVARYVLRAVR
ncbi:MAG: arylesterase [Alphaproteobacteria bacterium]|nr:arylesterase [Alphaproteobacteria bacterium]